MRRVSQTWAAVAVVACLVGVVVADMAGARPAVAQAIVIDTTAVQFRVSDRLVGLHFVYSADRDVLYSDGALARWARRSGIATARYPGGSIVKVWNWQAPTGVFGGDNWDPAWDPADNAPPDRWMSLDEYLDFVVQSGITPIFGVNSLSGEKHGRRDDSIARAAAMVRHAKERGFSGADWYIGNEDIHQHGGIEAFAEVFALHAEAMKRQDPSIKIFWNDNAGRPERIKRFLAHDRGMADGYETHGKWPYGGDPPGLVPGTFKEWQIEHPLRDRKNHDRAAGGRVWRQAADSYRQVAREAGRPDLLIANNEYGLGKPKNVAGFDRYAKGLLLTDLLSDLLIGNWDRTAFWSNVLPGTPGNNDERGLVSTIHGNRKNPVHLGMALIAPAQGGDFLRAFTVTDSIYGYAVKKADQVLVFVLNKSDRERRIDIRLDGHRVTDPPTAKAMVDTDDGFGAYRSIPVDGTVDGDGNASRLVVPAMSFTRLTHRVGSVSGQARPGRPHTPNIVLILADDLGYGDVGAFGQTRIATPRLDQMAREGVRFTSHYAGSPVCGPSRASLMTGLHTGHLSIRGNPRWTRSGAPVDLTQADTTVAEVLRAAGYRTAIIGKWGLAERRDGGPSAMPSHQGFDEFFGYRRHVDAHYHYRDQTVLYRDDRVEELGPDAPATETARYVQDVLTDEALAFIDRSAGQQPFFLYFASALPHFPVAAPDDAKAAYRDLGWPERAMKTTGHYRHDPEGNVSYAAMVSRLDRDVGRLLDRLRERGIAKDTIVIFTSDNGHEYDRGFFDSNGPFRGGKRDLYEGGIRMPTIAWWPGTIPADSRTDHVSAFWDFMATACDVADIDACPRGDGISYLPAALGEAAAQRQHDFLYWEFNERQGPIQALRAGRWKLVRFLGKAAELYDLAADPGESTDLAQRRPDVVARLTRLLEGARTDHPEFPLTPMSRRR